MKKKFLIEYIFLLLLFLFLSILLFSNSEKETYGNEYYANAVKSMSKNIKNLIYASYDPHGYFSLDKPPLGFWIQVLFSFVFGFNTFSLVLPQILSCFLCVLVIYFHVKKTFGLYPAFLSASMMISCPVFIAISRTNFIDSQLLLFSVLTVIYLYKGIAEKKGSYIILALLFFGLGYNIKYFQIFLIFPAILIGFILAGRQTLLKIKYSVLIAIIVFLLASFSWITFVELTPKNKRPYLDTSYTNSVLEVSFLVHALKIPFLPKSVKGDIDKDQFFIPRYLQARYDLARQENEDIKEIEYDNANHNTLNQVYRIIQENDQLGRPGLFRLVNKKIYSQISWLIILSIFCIFLLLGMCFADVLNNRQKLSLFIWTGWFLPQLVFFSVSSLIQIYYLIFLLPPLAVFISTGMFMLIKHLKNKILYVFFITSLSLTAIYQLIRIITYNWLVSVFTVSVTINFVLLMAVTILYFKGFELKKYAKQIFVFSFSLLLFPSVIWSATPALFGDNFYLPVSSPSLKQDRIFKSQYYFVKNNRSSEKFISFLRKNKNNEDYILAVPFILEGSSAMLHYDEPVMVLNGAMGVYPVTTVEKLKSMVKAAKLRYCLLINFMDLHPDLEKWIQANGTVVPVKHWFSPLQYQLIPEYFKGILYDLKIDNNERDL